MIEETSLFSVSQRSPRSRKHSVDLGESQLTSTPAKVVRKKTPQIADTNGQELTTSWAKAQTSPQALQPRLQIQPKKKLSLAELKKISPPGFQEFEAAIAWQKLDEETALLLWEDIFKPLAVISSPYKTTQQTENSLSCMCVKTPEPGSGCSKAALNVNCTIIFLV